VELSEGLMGLYKRTMNNRTYNQPAQKEQRRQLRMEVCIYHANDQKEAERKTKYIIEALDNLIEVKICVRVLHDSKQLSLKQFAYLCEKMVEVEDQLKKRITYYNQ
jgi:hypothetical protein